MACAMPSTHDAGANPADSHDPLAAMAGLADWLARQVTDATILDAGEPTPTVPAAAAALGVDEDAIIKSVLFTNRDGDRVLAVVRGTGRIDAARLGEATGFTRLKLADAPTVLSVTGFQAGGVPPVGHLTPVLVVVDPMVLERNPVYGGAGTDRHMLRIDPRRIVELAGAVVAPIGQQALPARPGP